MGQNDTLPNLFISNLEVINYRDVEEGISIDYEYQITNLSENDVNLGVLSSQVYVSDEQNGQEAEGVEGSELNFKLISFGETVINSSNATVPSGRTYLGLSINGEVEGVAYSSNNALAYINPPLIPPLSEDIIRRQLIIDWDALLSLSLNYSTLVRILEDNGGHLIEKCNCGKNIELWDFDDEGGINRFYQSIIEINGSKQSLQTVADTDSDPNRIITIDSRYPIWGYNASLLEKDTPKARDYRRNVTVYLLDSGLATGHFSPEKNLVAVAPNYDENPQCSDTLRNKGYNYLRVPAIDTDFSDDNGHGTFGFHAITGRLSDNDSIKIVPLKIFNENGEGTLFSMICALYHAIDNGADIVNISAGYYDEVSSILGKAIQAADDKGIWIVTSAGNCGKNIDIKEGDVTEYSHYPAAFAKKSFNIRKITSNEDTITQVVKIDNVISVASINPINDKLAKCSNFGSNTVTLAAYGHKICGYSYKGRQVIYSGTSMATFHTTRMLAIEMATNDSEDSDRVVNDFLEYRTTLTPETKVNRTLNMECKRHRLPPEDWFFNLLRSVGIGR